MIRGLRVPVHLTSRDALRIFDLADIWAARTGNDVRLVSANDHIHDRQSAHYEGLALDFHSSDPDGLSAALRGAGYRVLWNVPGHYGHVHVEDDRSTGVSAPALHATTQPLRRASRTRSRVNAGIGG
ncbi:MAG: hypothetical protein ACRD3C_03100 [Vicinamibacterales bacterium]